MRVKHISLVLAALASHAAFAVGPKVAVLPVINVSAEKWDELRKAVTDRASEEIQEQLALRVVDVIPKQEIEKAMKESQIDFDDEENWTKKSLYDIGDRVGSDYVVFVVITAQEQRTKQNFFTAVPEGEVEIKCWVVDVKSKEPILSAKSFRDKARPKGGLVNLKGSDQQKTAAERVIRTGLKAFFDKLELTEEGRKKVKK